uniref:Uncharacterized protein n=1 Tax=Amphimedon queenslandica TaxID=400682 RepID=A0A1X7UYL2_AMPQE
MRKLLDAPDIPETKCPSLNSVFKLTVLKKETKDADQELAHVQALIHDPAAPLLAMLRDGEELSVDQFKAALTTAVQLLGNVSAQVSRLRWRKILNALNPEIQDLADEDIFSSSAPYLFGGEEFEPKIEQQGRIS